LTQPPNQLTACSNEPEVGQHREHDNRSAEHGVQGPPQAC
jgi:hypothetical protein